MIYRKDPEVPAVMRKLTEKYIRHVHPANQSFLEDHMNSFLGSAYADKGRDKLKSAVYYWKPN